MDAEEKYEALEQAGLDTNDYDFSWRNERCQEEISL